jgi:hypothetical protein
LDVALPSPTGPPWPPAGQKILPLLPPETLAPWVEGPVAEDLVTKLQVLSSVVFLRLVGILWLLSSITYCSNFQKEKVILGSINYYLKIVLLQG